MTRIADQWFQKALLEGCSSVRQLKKETALKELQVEMAFQDQATGQRGQRHHEGTGLRSQDNSNGLMEITGKISKNSAIKRINEGIVGCRITTTMAFALGK